MQESGEGRYVAGGSFRNDLFLEIRPRIRLEICLGIIGKIDWREKPVTGSPGEIVSIGKFPPAERVQVLRSCRPPEQVHASTAEFPGTRPHQKKTESTGFNQAVNFVQEGGKPLDLIDDDGCRPTLDFFADPPRIPAERGENCCVKQIRDPDITESFSNEMCFAGLPGAKEKMGLLREKGAGVQITLD